MRDPAAEPPIADLTRMPRRAAAAIALVVLAVLAVATVTIVGRRTPSAPDFALFDQHGKRFVLSSRTGRAIVVFFGYTHCPDVCPTTMANEEAAIRRLGARGRDVDIAFVTVDPRRDDAAALGRYAAAFGPNVYALRGDGAELSRAWTGYHVYHQALAPRSGESGYTVVHSSAVFYVSRSGDLSAYGDWSDPQDAVAADLRKALE